MIQIFRIRFIAVPILSLAQVVLAQQVIVVPERSRAVMIDGKLAPGEWDDAAQLPLGNLERVYVKQSNDYVWMAVQFLTCGMFALDFYVQPADGSLYDLHSSAKIGEREFQGNSWPEHWTWWNNEGWTANWSRVDSFEQRTFLPQTFREYQISRRRFAGQTWRVMFELQLPAKPEWRMLTFPEGAQNNSSRRWITLQLLRGGTEEAEVLAAEGHYDHGALTKDLAELDATWADTFIDTSGPTVRNKREMLEVVKNGPKFESLRIDDRKIQVYGDTAVVTGRFTLTSLNNGKKDSEAGRFTDVWIRQNGKWLCVAAHSTTLGP